MLFLSIFLINISCLFLNLNIQIAIKSYEEEKEARATVEKSRDALSVELVKAGQEAKRLDDQVIIQFSICIWLLGKISRVSNFVVMLCHVSYRLKCLKQATSGYKSTTLVCSNTIVTFRLKLRRMPKQYQSWMKRRTAWWVLWPV